MGENALVQRAVNTGPSALPLCSISPLFTIMDGKITANIPSNVESSTLNTIGKKAIAHTSHQGSELDLKTVQTSHVRTDRPAVIAPELPAKRPHQGDRCQFRPFGLPDNSDTTERPSILPCPFNDPKLTTNRFPVTDVSLHRLQRIIVCFCQCVDLSRISNTVLLTIR
jgi:hypothetical protein